MKKKKEKVGLILMKWRNGWQDTYIPQNATWVYNHILLILKYYVSMPKSKWLWNHIQNIGWWWLIAPSLPMGFVLEQLVAGSCVRISNYFVIVV